MTNKEFIAELAVRMGKEVAETTEMTNQLVQLLTEQVADGQVVSFQGFGTFEVKKKMERVVVSPITKKRMLVPPKLTASFKPSATLKDRLK